MIRYCSFREINIRYSDEGKGRTVVLLHGFMESLDIWDDFSKALSRLFRVICIDLPGFGQTPAIGYVHSMALMARSVKAVLDNEGLKRYIIIGHSMGGYAGLAFADLYPDCIKGLGLFHSTAFADTEEKKRARNIAIGMVKKNPSAYVNLFFAPLFAEENRTAYKEEIEQLESRAGTLPKRSIINALEGMKDRRRLDWILEMAGFPVLFIAGKKDTVIPYQTVLKQAELVKEPAVLLLENSGHMGFLEEKKECLKAIRKFARKCFS